VTRFAVQCLWKPTLLDGSPGEYIRASSLSIEGRGIKTTPKISEAIKYDPGDDLQFILRWLGPAYRSVLVPPNPTACGSG